MGQVRPRRRPPKVSRFLTSKPGVQRSIGLLATWRTSEDCVKAKKIKSSSWSSVPDISALSSKFRRVRASATVSSASCWKLEILFLNALVFRKGKYLARNALEHASHVPIY
ncbi:hypothetical protein U9M48_003213 [Paspalum notatum var. saurae]|uniref:Uncharacterized protein n=1 Tax=Paspalum notatum var. saurae TaxID=547442 RepID=A0AAQ3PQN2_PASNO